MSPLVALAAAAFVALAFAKRTEDAYAQSQEQADSQDTKASLAKRAQYDSAERQDQAETQDAKASLAKRAQHDSAKSQEKTDTQEEKTSLAKRAQHDSANSQEKAESQDEKASHIKRAQEKAAKSQEMADTQDEKASLAKRTQDKAAKSQKMAKAQDEDSSQIKRAQEKAAKSPIHAISKDGQEQADEIDNTDAANKQDDADAQADSRSAQIKGTKRSAIDTNHGGKGAKEHELGAATSLPTGKHHATRTHIVKTAAPSEMAAFTTPTTTASITATTTLAPGGGWTEFTFGAAGSTVPTAFEIMSETPQIVRIVDLLCAGDRFAVYNNGAFIGDTTTPPPSNCTEVATDPAQAFTSGNWSVFAQQLPPGNNTITMTVLASPFGTGSAAISTEAGFGVCNTTLSGLHLVRNPLARVNYAEACTALGMRPADINVYNFDDATRVVFECVGAFSAAWIGSYWDNTYENSCLALYTGNAVPGASISVPASCEAPLPALCQSHPLYF